jgi:AcrR family transcriptional regulator
MPRAPKIPNAKPRRDEILDHATRLFAERGYEGTSMADLAERVGMRKASLFYHFASKDVLYAAVLDRLIVALTAVISTAANTEGSFVQRLDILSDAITTALGEQPYTARLMVREAMDWGPVIRDTLFKSVMDVLAVTEGFFIAGQSAGVFVPFDVKQMIVSMIGIHFMPFAIGGIVQNFAGSDPFDPSFVAARREAVRVEMRRLVLVDQNA